MFAVVETGGKQYKVAPGDQLDVELLSIEVGKQFDLGRVLMVGSDGGEVLVGSPLVDGARVVATVVAEHRGDKLIVFKYKPKKRYRRKNGHRQTLTRVNIDEIFADGIADREPKVAKAEPKKAKIATIAPVTEVAIVHPTVVAAAPISEVETGQMVTEVSATPVVQAVNEQQVVAATAPVEVEAAQPIAETTAEPSVAAATSSEPETVVTSTPIVEVRGVPTTDASGSGLDLQDAPNTDVETKEGKA